MNSSDAVRLMVRHFPGGVAAMAVRLGKSPHTLDKELRGDSGHKLGLIDACHISTLCNEGKTPHCRAYVNAVAGECGGTVTFPNDDRRDGAAELRSDTASLVKEAAEALCAITSALSDNVVSDNELRTSERELGEVVEQVQRVQVGLRSNNADSKPGRPGEALELTGSAADRVRLAAMR